MLLWLGLLAVCIGSRFINDGRCCENTVCIRASEAKVVDTDVLFVGWPWPLGYWDLIPSSGAGKSKKISRCITHLHVPLREGNVLIGGFEICVG